MNSATANTERALPGDAIALDVSARTADVTPDSRAAALVRELDERASPSIAEYGGRYLVRLDAAYFGPERVRT